MTEPTLRELAQAVVDAWESRHQGRERPTDVEDAYAILAALDAADAQGYARAMCEVVTEAEVQALGHRRAIQTGMLTNGRVRGGRPIREGANNALHDIAEWARGKVTL